MSARDRILDAAARVMTEQGLVRTTTKEIARAAGCSEALLYKHFADKQEICLGVLGERLPALDPPAELVGTGTVRGNLARLAERLMALYVRIFPIAASVFSSPELLASWRAGLQARGAGPGQLVVHVEHYLAGEVRAGRVDPDLDVAAAAAVLCGAAYQQAFLACFDGHTEVPDAPALAARLAQAVRL